MPTTALLILDIQNGIVERYGAACRPMLEALARATTAARAAAVPVIYVRAYFRPGAPEVGSLDTNFARFARSSGGENDPATAVHDSVAPQPSDLTVVKRRISAFAGSDLAILLRALGVRSLVLGGIATSGVVLSTLREAADLDFDLTVLRDGCADPDDEVHRVLLDKVFPRQATVRSVTAWVDSLS
ncbi:MAG: cysteine hydrolase [Actinomycetota bacterium]|nr:MAG: cysteine hydrolase [Actinomycetota bacterium]